ncbi:MAG: DUF4912 domain-containing protein [Clostridia bacterium]|nr:DUF4912 domain-containing protein [Clostridia bacterium]
MIETIIFAGIIIAIIAVATFRFYSNPKQPLKKPEKQSGEAVPGDDEPLLERYDKDQIVLMVRDPEWLYAYWEITATKQKQLSQQLGNLWQSSSPALRIYEVNQNNGHNNEIFFDIKVNEGTRNWYIHVGKPNQSFFIDLGRLLSDGSFLPILRSNLVTTPSNSFSQEIDPQWPPVEAIWAMLREQDYLDEFYGSLESAKER